MNAASIDSPNSWRRGPAAGAGAGAGAGGYGGAQPPPPPPTSQYGQHLVGSSGPLIERDVRNISGNNSSNYPPADAQSPLSPSSEFSLSKYDHQPQQPQQQRNNLPYSTSTNSNDHPLPNSRSNTSLMSQRSSAAAEAQDSVIIEHYTELHAYVTSNPPVDGTYPPPPNVYIFLV